MLTTIVTAVLRAWGPADRVLLSNRAKLSLQPVSWSQHIMSCVFMKQSAEEKGED